MIKRTDYWTALARQVDYVVDGRFAEPVVLIPWMKGTGIYTPEDEGPDPTRRVVSTTGVFVTPGANLVGESGRATGGSGGGFNTQMLEQEVWLSITTDKIDDVTAWREYDRVYFPDRNRFYNISYVEDSATYRPNIHLIRDRDLMMGNGSPVSVATPHQLSTIYFDEDQMQFWRATGTTSADWVAI